MSVCVASLPLLWTVHCRSAWLGVLAVVGYAACRRFTLPHWGKACAVLLSVPFLCWLYQVKADSADGRLLIWKVTARMISEKPLSGFGPRGFAADYMRFQADYLATEGTERERWLADNNHSVYNEPLRWTVEYGLAGLLVYVGLVTVVLRYRERDAVSLSAKAVCLAGLAWGFFSYPAQVTPVCALAAVALAEMANRSGGSAPRLAFGRRTGLALRMAVAAVLIAVAVLGLRMYRAHHELYRVGSRLSLRTERESVALLSRLERPLSGEPAYWACYCYALERAGMDSLLLRKLPRWERLYPSTHTYVMKGDALWRMGREAEAEAAYRQAARMVPVRQKARYRLALLYHSQGRGDEARRLAREILSERVKAYGFDTYEMHKELRKIVQESP